MKKIGVLLASLPSLLLLVFILTRPEMSQPDEPGTTIGDLLLGLFFFFGPLVLALLGAILSSINAKPTTHKTGRVLLLIAIVLSTTVLLIWTVGNTPILTTWLILSLVALAAGVYGYLLIKKS